MAVEIVSKPVSRVREYPYVLPPDGGTEEPEKFPLFRIRRYWEFSDFRNKVREEFGLLPDSSFGEFVRAIRREISDLESTTKSSNS